MYENYFWIILFYTSSHKLSFTTNNFFYQCLIYVCIIVIKNIRLEKYIDSYFQDGLLLILNGGGVTLLKKQQQKIQRKIYGKIH